MAENAPEIPPYFPIVPYVSPYAVAPDQWGDASVGGFYKVDVGGLGGGLEARVCGTLPVLVRGYPQGFPIRTGQGA